MQPGQNFFPVELKDGRTFNICTESGLNAFLSDHQICNEYLKANVKKMVSICAKQRLEDRDKAELLFSNVLFQLLAQHASPDVFRENVERSTIEAWLDPVVVQIKTFAKDQNWITTGRLANYEMPLLASCVQMMRHAVPVALAFEHEFFSALADFVKARKGTGRGLPHDDICHMFTMIVSNAYSLSTFENNPWTTKKALKELEATGVLEQFIRCVTVPQRNDSAGLFKFLDEFQACIPFLTKHVRPGQPCGDVIIDILEGRDGSRVQRPRVINKLQTMIRFSSAVDPEQKRLDAQSFCRYCGKVDHSEAFQNSLKFCGRCQNAFYCSRECQKADWKVHKKSCTPGTNKELVRSTKMWHTLMAFIKRHYVHIMVALVKACQQTGLSKDDLLLELNFEANDIGIVLAMQEKPEFQIVPVKDYTEGSRIADTDWLREYNIDVEGIKRKHSKLQPGQILCLVNYDGGVSTCQVERADEKTNKDTLSQEAVDALNTYMEDGCSEGPLAAILGYGETLQTLKLELFAHYGYGTPMEAMFAMAFVQSN